MGLKYSIPRPDMEMTSLHSAKICIQGGHDLTYLQIPTLTHVTAINLQVQVPERGDRHRRHQGSDVLLRRRRDVHLASQRGKGLPMRDVHILQIP